MSTVVGERDGLIVFVENEGPPTVLPAERITEVVEILTTTATVRRSVPTATGIADQVRTVQPGEPGHAAASLTAAGFAVSYLP